MIILLVLHVSVKDHCIGNRFSFWPPKLLEHILHQSLNLGPGMKAEEVVVVGSNKNLELGLKRWIIHPSDNSLHALGLKAASLWKRHPGTGWFIHLTSSSFIQQIFVLAMGQARS